MTILYVLIGIPGSGKSTWAKRKAEEMGAAWISRDQIRFSLIKDTDDYFAREDEVVKTFIQEIQDAIDSGVPYVIADATHLTPRSRMNTLYPLDLDGVEICNVYFSTDLETALERNALREGRARVPDDVIVKMHKTLNLPSNFLLVDKDGNEVHV